MANREFVFDDHYLANGAVITFGQGTANTTLKITARDETVATDANNVVGDGNLDSITSIVINFDGEAETVTVASIGTNATNFTVGSPGGLGDRVYNVQFVDVDPGAGVKYAVQVIGVLDTDTSIATFTADGYHNLELLNVTGDDFEITGFGAAVQTTNPVSFNLPVEVVDNDGDVAASSIGVTLTQAGQGIQNHSNDLVGDSHTYTSTGPNPHIIGSDFADTLNGDTASNVLYGGLGNDTLNGLAGSDTLIGGDGNDILNLGNLDGARDTVIFDATALGDTDTINQMLFGTGATSDVIDLSELFTVDSAAGHALSEYVQVSGTSLQVDVDGAAGAAAFVTIATLTGFVDFTSTVNVLYDDNQTNTDKSGSIA
jgi:Ca2+-binding RTX toxin-like protein